MKPPATLSSQSTKNALVERLLVFGVAITTHLLTRIPIWRHPMVGDDFLLVRDSKMPVRGGSILENLWLVGSGKWRPVSTLVLLWLGQWFGYSYAPFQILNSVLLVACAVLAGWMALRIGGSWLSASVVTIVVVTSQFTWMAQTSVYGVMELLALMFVLAGVAAALSAVQGGPGAARSARWSIGFLLLASLTHERYILSTIVLTIVFLTQLRTPVLRGLAWISMLVPVFFVSIRVFVLDLSPLQTGGETGADAGARTWVVRHLWDALQMIAGGHTGSGTYYSSDHPLATMRSRDDLGWIAPCILAMVVVIIYLSGRKDRTRLPNPNMHPQFAQRMLLAGFAVTTLVPSALVAERIEGRWLLAPQTILLLLAVSCVPHINAGKHLIRQLSIPLLFMVSAVYQMPNSADYLSFRDRPSLVLEDLRRTAPQEDPWVLVMSNMGDKWPVNWQFGYGDSFIQLPNPPYLTILSGDRRRPCPIMRSRVTCVVIRLDPENRILTKSTVMTRLAPISSNRK